MFKLFQGFTDVRWLKEQGNQQFAIGNCDVKIEQSFDHRVVSDPFLDQRN